jgi:hypothetical protein
MRRNDYAKEKLLEKYFVPLISARGIYNLILHRFNIAKASRAV